jgi:3-oxoacyl-[acyl-carrier protein] reductase
VPCPSENLMRSICGKRALVTGAASGIGRAIALRLARKKADLFLIDIDGEGLAEVTDQARQYGVQVRGYRCDVADSAQIAAATDAALAEWGAIDILVNNAGVCYYGSTVHMRQDQWRRLLAINLLAPIEFTHRLLPSLLERPEAHVLNVSSMYGFVVTNRCCAYHTSKFGLLGFTEALRAEYGRRGLGVTALCPGFVTTDLFTSMVEPDSPRPVRLPPRWICATPERVAVKAVRAIYRDQRIALVTPLAYLAYYGRWLAPGFVDAVYRLGRRRCVRARQARLAAASAQASPAVSRKAS